MQTVNDTYRAMLRDPSCVKEPMVLVGSDLFGQDRILSLEVSGGLFAQDSPCVGSAVARELEMSVRRQGDVGKAAEVWPVVSLRVGDRRSEPILRGAFFIDTRETDSATGVLTVHAFDAMILTEREWVPDQAMVFPMPMDEAVTALSKLLNLEVDPRTVLRHDYTIDYPATGTTMRQVLQWIGGAHGGNWTITEEGRLRLVPLRNENADVVELGREAAGIQIGAALDPITRIVVNVDNANRYEAGDDTGLTLEVDCPYGTQAIADDLLALLGGYVYLPFEAADAVLDPAAELGDTVIVNGVPAPLVRADTVFDALMTSDISAPGHKDTESELGVWSGPLTSMVERRLARTYSAIEKSAEEVRAYVQDNVTDALAEVDVRLGEISQRVSDGETKAAEIETKVDGIKLEVTQSAGADGTVTARITLKVGPNSYSGFIKMDGNLEVSGQLSADALYAALGDIAQLTVDQVSTSRRIPMYLAGDTGDDNFIRISGMEIEFVTGSTDGSTEQAVAPTGLPLYWEDDPSGADLSADGYPYRGGERIFTTTSRTAWPVTVYVYSESVKRRICFDDSDGQYVPTDIFGAGNGAGGQFGRLVKAANRLELIYVSSSRKEVGIIARDSGYLDLYGLRRPTALDFSGWDSGYFTERVDGDGDETEHRFGVSFDSRGRPERITDSDGHSTQIRW